jgi:hypothetical protein
MTEPNGNGLSKEEVMSKIKKLMRLATSPVEAEARLAMEKAAFLLEKYSLTLEECQTEEQIAEQMIRFDLVGRTEKSVMWEAILGFGIAKCFDVDVVRIKDWNGWKLALMGTKPDVDMATYFITYLRRIVGRTVDTQNDVRGISEKNTFAHGMVTQIIQRLELLYKKRQEIKTSDSLALTVVKQDQVSKFKKQNFPHTAVRKVSPLRGTRSSWEKGKAAGDKVSLGRAIAGNQQRKALA